ncbi:MAG TPA: glycosyltransferase family 87 protein [Gaiellaceae bacterium]
MAEGVLPAIRLWPRVRRFCFVAPIILRSTASAVLFLGVIPIAMYVPTILHAVTGDRRSSDFLSFWEAGGNVLHSQSPYPLVDALPAVADRFTFEPFVYPAPAAFGMVPFAILPFAVAATLFLLLSFGAIVGALRLLNVRDWRCYGAVFGSVPVLAGTSLGTFSPLLLLGAAAAWRYRDRVSCVAPVVAALVVAKLFLWPLGLWLVYTRRFTAAAVSAALGLVVTFVAWWLIGFAGLHDYPRLLSRLSELTGINSYSLYAVGRAAGAAPRETQVGVFAVGVVLAIVAARALRAGRNDERVFVASIGLALLLTPILWPHYLMLIFVPIALVRREFSALWLLPLVFWLDGHGWSYGEPARIVPFLAIAAVPIVLALKTAR